MKQSLLLLALPLFATAQTSMPDSTSVKELGEITVVAANSIASPAKTVYIPTSKQRNASTDGTSLLLRMNIPQLNVNPLSGDVKTVDNNPVTLFINSRRATKEEVEGLNPADVRRVEYLNFPTDPAFLGEPHVVNFITRRYLYGGYSKLSGKERFLVSSGEASIYSKFAYKKMEYDMMATTDYDRNRHHGTTSTETYRFPERTVSRVSDLATGRHHENGVYAALRATWVRDERLSLSNLVSIFHKNTSVNTTTGNVSFSSLYPVEEYETSSPEKATTVNWECNLNIVLGNGLSLNSQFESYYSGNVTDNDYATASSSILNHADEKSWFAHENLRLNKTIDQRFTAFSFLVASTGQTKIDYSGSSDMTNRFNIAFTGAGVGLSMNWHKLTGSVDGGLAFESNSINGKRMNDLYPFTHVNLQYAPDTKNSIGLWFQYASMTPDASMKNPNVIRQTELMYVGGNPDLKCSRHISVNASYTWLPSNSLQLTGYAVLFRIMNRQIAVYSPDAPGGMMLKKYYNDGDYNHAQIGASLTANFFEGKLSAAVSPRLLVYNVTGSNPAHRYPLICSLNVNYYLGNFYFDGYWGSATSYVDGVDSFVRKMPSEYSLGAGWTDRGWNIQLAIANLFRSSWKTSSGKLVTRWYDCANTTFGPDCRRRISLNVTYTISYGKKVSHAGEIQNSGGAKSSILR